MFSLKIRYYKARKPNVQIPNYPVRHLIQRKKGTPNLNRERCPHLLHKNSRIEKAPSPTFTENHLNLIVPSFDLKYIRFSNTFIFTSITNDNVLISSNRDGYQLSFGVF